MKVRVFLATAALIVFVLAFAACGNGNGNGGGTAQATPAPAPAPAPAPTTPDAPTPDAYVPSGNVHEAVDFGGRVLRLASWIDPDGGLIEIMNGDEPDPATADDYWTERLMWDNARRVEEVFNVRFEFIHIPYDHDIYIPTLTTSVLAGDPVADIMLMSGHQQTSAILGNLILPWSNISLPGSDLFGPGLFTRVITTGVQQAGEAWVVDRHRLFADAEWLGVNLDIIHAEGLQNPVDLYYAGQWTWDAFLEIARLATRDTDGDGIIDQFGIAGQPGDLAQNFVAANDGVTITPDANYGFDHPNTIEALELWEIIMHERLWSHLPEGYDLGDWGRNFWSGIREANAAIFQAAVWQLSSEPPAFDYAVVPFPIGPSNRTGSTFMTGGEQGWTLVGGGSAWEPYEILIVLEELWSWALDDLDLMVEGGTLNWFRSILPTEGDVQRVARIGLTGKMDLGRGLTVDDIGYTWIFGGFLDDFWTRTRGVADAVEYHRGPRQEMLDRAFRQ